MLSPLQVPDIYDSAKYDAIHNRELGLELKHLYEVSLPSIAVSAAVLSCQWNILSQACIQSFATLAG